MLCPGPLCAHVFVVHCRGTLVAVPAPEHLAIPNDVYEAAVAQAEMEASYEDVRAGLSRVCVHYDYILIQTFEQIHGEQLTEYLFKRVDEITEHSLTRTLRGLLVHNASVVRVSRARPNCNLLANRTWILCSLDRQPSLPWNWPGYRASKQRSTRTCNGPS